MFYYDLAAAIKKRYYRLLLKPFLGKLGIRSYIISPLRIEGIGNIFIGKNSIIMNQAWLCVQKKMGATLKIGNNTYIGNFSHIDCAINIEIGDNVTIADKVYIGDNNYEIKFDNSRMLLGGLIAKNVSIGNNCWIGESSIILSCCIGNNVIVGAGSVVKNDVQNNCVVAGNPAKIIKFLNLL